MKFLATWQTTKIKPLYLLDMAYVVVLLPLFLLLKLPMLLFLFAVIVVLFVKKEPFSTAKTLWVLFFGVLALFFSMYGAFSFQGLSRLKLFIELLLYILLVVVSMQRLTQKINFYLLISPMLFFALSLFFFHSFVMLMYVVFEIFFLLWMILSHRMESNLLESFRVSMVMFLYSLPWVVLLFIFFPRISFEHASYGFKGEHIQRMGHDGTMYLDNDALLVPSERVVMEVGFEKKIPANETLYFRGSILYVDKKNHWEPLPKYFHRRFKSTNFSKKNSIKYNITLYPTQKRWLYMLEKPQGNSIIKSTLDDDFVTLVEKDIQEPLHYKAFSLLNAPLDDTLTTPLKKIAGYFDVNSNYKTQKIAQQITTETEDVEDKSSAIYNFFKQQDLTYTLKPDLLDLNHTTDSFLFDKKRGYCVHFASSFVTMARMVGIPARVVTGYKADRSNSYNNYLVVKESDAHAWAELYIDGRWKRFETTATAAHIDVGTTQLTQKKETFFNKINFYLMYVKYQVDTWILNYSNLRQLQLLKYAKDNPIFIFGFVMALLLLFVVSLFFARGFKQDSVKSDVLKILQPLLGQLEKEGYTRNTKETMHSYLLRYMESTKDKEKKLTIEQIDTLYQKMTYADENSSKNKKVLKELVRLLR